MTRSPIGIVASRADDASMAIRDALLENAAWTRQEPDDDREGRETVFRTEGFELRTFDRLHLELESAASAFDQPAAVLFVSRHAGETGPLLSTHVPGNVGAAEYGGAPHTLPAAASGTMRAVFDGLQEHAPAGYDVALECTHHGPSTVGAPTLFVEIGSGPDQWTDPEAAVAVASAILAARDVDPVGDRTLAGFGGGHYAPRFRRILAETGWHVGHVAADWSLEEIDDDDVHERVVGRALEASATDLALVDGTRPRTQQVLRAHGARVVGETGRRVADGVPIGIVESIERALGPIDEGTRIGDVELDDPDAIEVRNLPDELVDVINGRAADAARSILEAETIAFRTNEGGNRIAGPVAVFPSTRLADLVDRLRPPLVDTFDAVSLADDELVLREEVFDPSAARALNVPEGPAFGRLAEGEPVEVDGERIDPADVLDTREVRIPLTDD